MNSKGAVALRLEPPALGTSLSSDHGQTRPSLSGRGQLFPEPGGQASHQINAGMPALILRRNRMTVSATSRDMTVGNWKLEAGDSKLKYLKSEIALAMLIAGLALVSGCSSNGARGNGADPAPAMMPAVPATIAIAVQKTVAVEVHAIGNGEAYSNVQVKSQVEGQLDRVNFQEGQDVKKGVLLFTIDSRPFEAALKQAEANLARDLAQQKYAQAQAERAKKLFEDGITSRDQFDQLVSNAAALDAAVRADRAAIESSKIQLGYCSIYSPLDGRTGSLMVHPGNVVKANDTTLVVINQISPLYVDFTIPEQYLADIKKYMARGAVRVEASVPNDAGDPEQGAVSFVNNTVDATTGTILLKATFSNPRKRLWPGQFANLVLKLTSLPNVVVVPAQAVQTGQAGQYVFVVKDDRSVEMRPVVPGTAAGGEQVIEKGLRAGETVVTDGQLMLFPGARIQVKESGSPGK